MKKETFLTPDFEKKRFSITMDVFENAQSFEVSKIEGTDNYPSYQEIMGALEIQKTNFMIRQSLHNLKEYDKIFKKYKKTE